MERKWKNPPKQLKQTNKLARYEQLVSAQCCASFSNRAGFLKRRLASIYGCYKVGTSVLLYIPRLGALGTS